MAAVATPVSGASFVLSNKRARVYDITFTGSYAANGDAITAASVGLKRIEFVLPQGGMAAASTPTTANEIGLIVAADGSSVSLRQYENAAAGSPSAEKGAEAYITGQTIRLMFIGY